jgi:hypothetical protein
MKNWFKVPPLPTAPVALAGEIQETDKETVLGLLRPCDAGFTRGHGALGNMENFWRMKTNESDQLFTHFFMVRGKGADPEIVESNWPCVRRGLNASTYFGEKRHTVFARYLPLSDEQRKMIISTADTMVAVRTPYAGGQILGFFQMLVGAKVGNKSGVTCIEFGTYLYRGVSIPFAGKQESFLTTPSGAEEWVEKYGAPEWEIIAEQVGDRFWIKK